jgi:hypothetical protein
LQRSAPLPISWLIASVSDRPRIIAAAPSRSAGNTQSRRSIAATLPTVAASWPRIGP